MHRLALAAGLWLAAASPAWCQQYYLSEILYLAANFCPNGTLPANGALLSISSNVALFSLLGINYGGNGTSNFALPKITPPLTANRQPLTACIVTAGIFPARD